MDVMDADASSDVSAAELLVGVGMLRRQHLDLESLSNMFARLVMGRGSILGLRPTAKAQRSMSISSATSVRFGHTPPPPCIRLWYGVCHGCSCTQRRVGRPLLRATASRVPFLTQQSTCRRRCSELNAPQLVKLLGISQNAAEELIFLADLDRFSSTDQRHDNDPTRSIDIEEFHWLVIGST
eukprot:1644190-Prymnesium_polylepis.2